MRQGESKTGGDETGGGEICGGETEGERNTKMTFERMR